MRVKNTKSVAATQREQKKRDAAVQQDQSVDPDFLPIEDPDSDANNDAPMDTSEMNDEKASRSKEEIAQNRKRRHDNADLYDSAPRARSATTLWRQANKKTKKAHIQHAQPSIMSLFKPVAREEMHPPPKKRAKVLGPAVVTYMDASMEVADEGKRKDGMILIEDPTPHQALTPISTGVVSTATLHPPTTTASPSAITSCPSVPIPIIESNNDPCDTDLESDASNTLVDGARMETARQFHHKVEKSITKLEKELRKPKRIISDTKAANQLVDLNLIRRYNDERLRLTVEWWTLSERIKVAPLPSRPKLKARRAAIRPAENASLRVANAAGKTIYYASSLRQAAHHLHRTGTLPETRQGKGAVHASNFNNPEIRLKLEAWSKGLVDEKEGGFKGRMKPEKLLRYVNEFLLPQLGIEDKISVSTSVRWLRKLGYRLSRYTKGIYFDGHERDDVVKKREELLNYLYLEILPYCVEYIGADVEPKLPSLKDGEKIHRLVAHDETCVHANDQSLFVWEREDEHELRKKERGRVVHISGFILEESGILKLTEEEIVKEIKLPKCPLSPAQQAEVDRLSATEKAAEEAARKAAELEAADRKKKRRKAAVGKVKAKPAVATDRTVKGLEWTPPPPPAPHLRYRCETFDASRIIHPGKGHDPYWDMPQLIVQTKDAIDIFEAKFPDDVAVFLFDCSSAHEAYSSDALLAHKMNRGPGGAQPKMHSTVIPSSGEVQQMFWPDNYDGEDSNGEPLAGKAKGMEQVLRERDLLKILEAKGHAVGVCKECKKSEKLREKEAKLRRAEKGGEADLEGAGDDELDDEDEGNDEERPNDCCMQRLLSQQADFKKEKPLLQVLIERRGHKCLFLPKFHCELNPIELVWAQLKCYFRERADGTFPTAQKLVPECLNAIMTANIRRYFRHCYRYMDAYKNGLNPRQAAYAVKKYTSHRRIPQSAFVEQDVLSRA